MPNTKITAMPSLGGNQVPTDLVTAVDLSAAPVNQNVRSTLNDLFSIITKNITDRAIRFQAPGSAPAVAAASQGALYHNGTAFLASSNGGAYEQLYTLTAQSAALIFAGPTSGPAATPTFRALALTDLPTLATASLLGRSSAGTGTPEQITSTAALLTWLTNPISANLSAAVTDSTGAGGGLVFAFNPVLTNPRFNTIAADPSGSGSNLLFTPSVGAVNHIEILNATTGSGPTIRPTGLSANQPLNLASRGTGIISCVGNRLRVTGDTAATAGILDLRGGNASLSGGQIRLHEVSTNGTNYIGFHAPDILATNLLFELPATDGTAGQVLSTDGAGILSWATRGTGTVTSVGLSAPSILSVANSPVTGSGTLALSLATQSAALVFAGPTSGGAAAPTFRALALTDLPQIATGSLLGRSSAGFGTPEQITSTAALLTWIQTPSSADNLRFVLTSSQTSGLGRVVFENTPGLISPDISGAFVTNISNGVPLRILNTGTGNSFVVEDEFGDGSPFIITSDGRLLIGATTGGLASKMTFAGLTPISGGVSQVLGMGAVFGVGCTFGYGNGTRFDTPAGASLTQITHYGAFQGTFTGSVVNQIAFEADNLTGATNNFGFYSSITAGTNRWAVYAIGGASSLFSGQVQFAAGSAAAPSITLQADTNTGLAQIGGADTISISTGGTERLRAKSGGAIRFIPLTAAPGSPEAGDVYFNSTTNKLQVYNGATSTWQDCN